MHFATSICNLLTEHPRGLSYAAVLEHFKSEKETDITRAITELIQAKRVTRVRALTFDLLKMKQFENQRDLYFIEQYNKNQDASKSLDTINNISKLKKRGDIRPGGLTGRVALTIFKSERNLGAPELTKILGDAPQNHVNVSLRRLVKGEYLIKHKVANGNPRVTYTWNPIWTHPFANDSDVDLVPGNGIPEGALQNKPLSTKGIPNIPVFGDHTEEPVVNDAEWKIDSEFINVPSAEYVPHGFKKSIEWAIRIGQDDLSTKTLAFIQSNSVEDRVAAAISHTRLETLKHVLNEIDGVVHAEFDSL